MFKMKQMKKPLIRTRVARSLARPTGRVGSENLEGCAGRVKMVYRDSNLEA